MVCTWVCCEVCCHGSHVPSLSTVGEVTLNLDNMMAQKRTAVSQLITSSALGGLQRVLLPTLTELIYHLLSYMMVSEAQVGGAA